ncbi:MAG: nucleotidyltransferase domain-containing protein [Candidatus Omnitrophota bacterium]
MYNLTISDIKEKLNGYFSAQRKIKFAYLFGSAASNKTNKFSDIDIAVFLNENISIQEYSDRKLSIMNDLSKIFDKNIDIVILNNANSFLKYQVLKNGVEVYESYKGANRNFKVYAVLEYFDFLFIRRNMEDALIRRIKERKHG